ncbi:MAG: DMT family transporter, partial [Desulfobacterales bacterium]|nr:DMT family transporter [Desulfobacterales bacterium]
MKQALHWLKTSRIAAVLIINAATLSWAGNMVLGRWLRDYIHPFSLSAMRYTIAFALFLLVLQKQSPMDRSPRGDGRMLFAMALCGVALFPCLLYLGLRYTTAINATIINACGPMLT